MYSYTQWIEYFVIWTHRHSELNNVGAFGRREVDSTPAKLSSRKFKRRDCDDCRNGGNMPSDTLRKREPPGSIESSRGSPSPSAAPPSYTYESALPPESAMLVEILKHTEVQHLFSVFHQIIGITIAIIDRNANVLFSSPWQRICTQRPGRVTVAQNFKSLGRSAGSARLCREILTASPPQARVSSGRIFPVWREESWDRPSAERTAPFG